jgi:hypothetical protein
LRHDHSHLVEAKAKMDAAAAGDIQNLLSALTSDLTVTSSASTNNGKLIQLTLRLD